MNRNFPRFSIYVVLSILAIVGGYYYWSQYLASPEYDIRKFSGRVVNIEGETITLLGAYNFQENFPKELSEEREFKFKVNSATLFDKIQARVPSMEELEIAGKVKITATGAKIATYSIEELGDQFWFEGPGSLDDFKKWVSAEQSVYVQVEFSHSIYNSTNPVASRFFYKILIDSYSKNK